MSPLRPIAFFAVFFAIVVGPQIAFHLARAAGWIPRRDLTWVSGSQRGLPPGYVEDESALRLAGTRFADPVRVFGHGVDPLMISDLRLAGVTPFAGADAAQMAVTSGDATITVARFPDGGAARRAANEYLTLVTGTVPTTSTNDNWTVTRPVGDIARVLVAGRTLIALTGPDAATVETMLQRSQLVRPSDATGSAPGSAEEFWLYRPVVLVSLTLLLVLVAALWFFRGAAWAGTIEPPTTGAVQSTEELRRRLLAINSADVPFTAVADGSHRIVVSWRFADARWLDLARGHRLQRTHRILIDLDERAPIARIREQQSQLDWSVGGPGGSLKWATSLGIVFWQQEYQRVFGVQVTPEGWFQSRGSYAYSFNLQEMKVPLIAAVTGAGWSWRPVVWRGPTWLQWLTT